MLREKTILTRSYLQVNLNRIKLLNWFYLFFFAFSKGTLGTAVL